MFDPHPRTGVRSHRLLVTITLVVARAGAGFAIGRHPDIGKGAQAASLAPASWLGTAAPTHDSSVPDTADTLGQEKLGNEDAAPTF
jgi:hypothetical protein